MNTNLFILSISKNYIFYFWLIMAIAFLLAELGTPGLFFFIAFAIGCVTAAPFVFFGYSFAIQCLIALFSSIISFFLLRRFCAVRDRGIKEEKTNVDAMQGQVGVVLREIRFVESGQVKVGGEIWSAKTIKDQNIDKGTKIRVVKVEGNHLVVSKITG